MIASDFRLCFSRSDDMSCFRLIPVRHLLRRSHFLSTINHHPWVNMESIQEKSKLADERIQQLKSLIATIGAGEYMTISSIISMRLFPSFRITRSQRVCQGSSR